MLNIIIRYKSLFSWLNQKKKKEKACESVGMKTQA